MKHLILLILISLSTTAFSQIDKNWYFDFHSSQLSISGNIISPDGTQKFSFTGDRKVTVSEDKKQFIESSNYIYQTPKVSTFSMVIPWKKSKEKNKFEGKSKNGAGQDIILYLKIKNKTEFTIKSKSLDGMTSIENGEIKPDGKVYVEGNTKLPNGDILFTFKYTITKTKRENKSQ